MKISKIFILLTFLISFLSIEKNNAQIVINEFSAANYAQFLDNFGSTEDWVELYNQGSTSVDISGYYLSDDPKKPIKWQFPKGTSIVSKGFIRVWCSGRPISDTLNKHYHASFRFTQTKKTNETVVFSSPTQKVVDQIKVTETANAQSWARIPDGGVTWKINTTPSPNASNAGAITFKGFAERPKVNIPAGFYKTSQNITLTASDTSLTIRYTLDGKEPTLKSPIYTKAIKIDTVKILKARSFSKDATLLPSFVQFNTYFINKTHTLIVLSISGDSLEILANGNNQIKPPGSFEYFLQDKSQGSKGYGEFNPHGQDSWKNAHRSIDFQMRDEFGYNSAINEKIFDLSNRSEFQKVILRAAGDDNYPANLDAQNKGSAHMRDAYLQNLAKRGGLDLDVRTAQKAIVYINGKYWGVYDIRERPDDNDYTSHYYNQDKYNLQYIQTWGNTWAEYGGNTALTDWTKFQTFILKNDMAVDSNYQKVKEQLDVKSLIDYVYVNTFSVCSDWLNYNTGWWRGMDAKGTHRKWGYTLWDNDAIFAFYINYTGIKDTSATASICQHELLTNSTVDKNGHIRILNKLRKNKEFDQYYITRQMDLNNTVFSKQNMLTYFDSVYNVIKPEMPQQVARWGGTMTGWEANVKRLRNFIIRRSDAVQNNIKPCYKLTGPYPLTLTAEPLQQVKEIQFNSMTITKFPWTGSYYGGIDNKVNVIQTNGTKYSFDKWLAPNSKFSTDSTKQVASFKLNKADTIVARFKILSDVDDNTLTNNNLRLYPTVASQKATVEFTLPESMPIRIELYNMNGQKVQNVVYQIFEQGDHQYQFDLSDFDLTNGVYIVKFSAGKYAATTKMIYQK